MTPPERLNDRPAAIRSSRCRAPARYAEMRSNSDNDRHNACPKMQNKSAFSHAIGIRASETVAPRSCNSSQAICRLLKAHS
jgi:hypothetical protein